MAFCSAVNHSTPSCKPPDKVPYNEPGVEKQNKQTIKTRPREHINNISLE